MICGAHQSVSGGLARAFERGALDTCKAIQIFTKNSNMWREPALAPDVIETFRKAHAAFGGVVMAHGSYLMNLAADKSDILAKSKDSLVAEVQRSSALGVQYVVLHPGAHLGAGDEVALARVVESLDEVHERTAGASAKILIENTAGQGSCVGHRFDHIASIFEGVNEPGRLGVCFDTQHAFAAGYDLASDEGYEKTWSEFESTIGIAKLAAFHLNDSKKPLGARVDRHEHIGDGNLGLTTFWRLVNDARFANTPAVLETEPREGDTPYKEEVALLASLVGAKRPPAPVPAFSLAVQESPVKAKKKGSR